METVVEALQDVAQTDLKVFGHLAVLLVFTSLVRYFFWFCPLPLVLTAEVSFTAPMYDSTQL